jgi:hypothetical protein
MCQNTVHVKFKIDIVAWWDATCISRYEPFESSIAPSGGYKARDYGRNETQSGENGNLLHLSRQKKFYESRMRSRPTITVQTKSSLVSMYLDKQGSFISGENYNQFHFNYQT